MQVIFHLRAEKDSLSITESFYYSIINKMLKPIYYRANETTGIFRCADPFLFLADLRRQRNRSGRRVRRQTVWLRNHMAASSDKGSQRLAVKLV